MINCRVLLLSLVVASAPLAATGATRYRSPLMINGQAYEISGSVQPLRSEDGLVYLRLTYTVKAGNKEFFPTNDFGGTLISCTTSNDASLPKEIFQPITVDGQSVGWLVKGLGICGNTLSEKIHIVYPVPYSKGRRRAYAVREVDAKTSPKIFKGKDGIEVWYLYQEWGRGGTAASFFVPHRLKLAISYNEPRISDEPIGAMAEAAWPSFESFDYKHFSSLFVAALEDNDPDLMKIAVEKYFSENEREISSYQYAGLPSTKEVALRAMEALKVLHEPRRIFKE